MRDNLQRASHEALSGAGALASPENGGLAKEDHTIELATPETNRCNRKSLVTSCAGLALLLLGAGAVFMCVADFGIPGTITNTLGASASSYETSAVSMRAVRKLRASDGQQDVNTAVKVTQEATADGAPPPIYYQPYYDPKAEPIEVQFMPYYPIYLPSQFPSISGVCTASPKYPAAIRGRQLKLFSAEYMALDYLPGYATLQDCLSCCTGGCQAQGSTLRGMYCVSAGESIPSEQPAYVSGNDKPLDSSLFMADGGAVCSSYPSDEASCELEPLLDSGDYYQTYNGNCSGFVSLSNCFNCCEGCKAEHPGATFAGSSCAPMSGSVLRPIAGRPLIDSVSGSSLVTPLVPSASLRANPWVSRVASAALNVTSPSVEDLAAALAWEDQARAEHASVASFSVHLLDLIGAGGVPPGILEDVASAAADEVRHAQQSLEVAALLRGVSEGSVMPGPLRATMSSGEEGQQQLASLAGAVFREGCLGETQAAAVAVAAELLADRDIGSNIEALRAARQAGRAIATEEAGHAQLAWRTLLWALRAGGPEAKEAVAIEVDKLSAVEEDLTQPGDIRPQYGLLMSAAEKRMVGAVVKNGLVLPWARALLSSGGAEEMSEMLEAVDGGVSMKKELRRLIATWLGLRDDGIEGSAFQLVTGNLQRIGEESMPSAGSTEL